MAAHMFDDLCTPANPRQVTLETCKEILRDCAFDSMDSKAGAPLERPPDHGGPAHGAAHRGLPRARDRERDRSTSRAGVVPSR